MSKSIAIAVIIILLIAGYFIFTSSSRNISNTSKSKDVMKQDDTSSPVPQTVDKKASFAIFTNGIFRIFTASMYHNLSEDVYIQADNPNIVLVKKSGVTWNDFFKTLPFSLTKSCLTTGTKETFCTNQSKTLKFYINGVQYDNLLDREIKDGDKALISFGSENEEQVQEQIEKLNVLSR